MKYLEALEKIIKITENKCFLLYGTLLGCIRDGDFIPWDDDMDIGILEEDFKEEWVDEFKKYFNVITSVWDDRVSKIRLGHGELHTCFDILRKIEDQRHFKEGNIELRIPDKFLQKFKEVPFSTLTVRVPVNSEEFLEWDYGKDWKIPKKEYSWTEKPGLIK